MYRIGWFSTGRDPAARQLLTAVWEAMRRGELQARLEFVFSNREPGVSPESDRFLDLVRSYGLPLICLSSQRFKALPRRHLDYDREVMARLAALQPKGPDLSVLAGYMLIVGPEMCQRYDLINLHPAAPGGPAGTWQDVIWQLIAERAERTGAMMHLVTPELDQGPPVAYCTFSLQGPAFAPHWRAIEDRSVDEIRAVEGESNALFGRIRAEGIKREVPLVVETLKAFAEGQVRIARKTVVDSAGRPIAGHDLTQEIEKAVGVSG